MNFRALVLIPDDVPDGENEVFDPKGIRLITGPVPVWLNFDMYLRREKQGLDGYATRLGYATLEKGDDGRIYANIEFNSAWHPNTLKRLTPCVGGASLGRNWEGGRWVLRKTRLDVIALCTCHNTDWRIPSLGEQGFNPL